MSSSGSIGSKNDMGNSLLTSKNRQRLILFGMAVPLFAMVIVFNYFPLWGWVMAFVKYRPGVPICNSPFVGLQYFAKIFESGSDFLSVFRNTLIMGLLGLICIPLAVILALMLNECKVRIFNKVIQTASSLPNFISMVIVYSIFFKFLSVEDGLVNVILVKWHVLGQPIDFLANENMVYALQTFVGIWKGLGWTAIIFISAISSVDQELYEAAVVDGAGRFQKIWFITIPGIMPTVIIMTILSIGYLLSSGFEQYYLFYNGMVASRIEVIDTYVYRTGIAQGSYSFATAVGISKTIISVLLLSGANLLAKKTTSKSIF